MSFLKRLATLLTVASLVAGCAYPGEGPRESSGQLIGGATGAIIGSQFGRGHGRLAAVAIGTMLGVAVGGNIGRNMDEEDKRLSGQAAQKALEYSPDHQMHSWKNPNKAHSGTFEVTNTVEVPQTNKVCRDFVNTVVIDGQHEKAHGRACRDVRDPKAAWIIQ